MANKGVFIVLEGLDGSGKTTQAKTLVDTLKESYDAIFTQEPSSGIVGSFIRNSLLYGETRPPTSVEALLFAADRAAHVHDEILPALEAGQVIVCDRYLYSSLAYQGSAGLSLDWIETINQHALKPDLALFIDVDPQTVLSRLNRKKSVMENLQTQKSVRDVYMHFIENGQLKRVDGNKSQDLVAIDILNVVTTFLETRLKL